MNILRRGLLVAALVLAGWTPAAAQTTVQGTVVNAQTQAPVAGARVLVRGSTQGTVTDAAWRYTISAPATGTLLFSALGYETLEEAVNGRTTINVSLTSSAVELEGLVVVATLENLSQECLDPTCLAVGALERGGSRMGADQNGGTQCAG